MNYQIAKKLREIRFPQSLDPNAEYYITDEILVRRHNVGGGRLYFDDSKKTQVALNYLVYKPTLEELFTWFKTDSLSEVKQKLESL